MRRLLFLLLCSSAITANAQHPATVKEYRKTFPTYPFSDPNPIPLLSAVYPYFRYDGFTDKPIDKSWKVVELENDYIRLLILPEIGGKIWAAIEKSTGQPFLYYNHAVKFRDVAMRGPWTSGGLEANYGIIGHTPNCATPVDYITRSNKDGSVSCIIGTLDLLTRSNWRIKINLPKDKAYFTTQSFWHNGTEVEQPYYHWMNAGIKAKGNLEFIYPGTHYIGHAGENADWPVNKSNGKKIAWYEENNFGGYKSYHVFGKYTDFFGAYWHDEDHGMVRYGSHDDKAGKKIWIWGLSRQGMIWEKMLTDTDSQYVEVQSGRLFNQNAEESSFTPFKHRSFAPYATDEWKEYWYPVLHTKGMVKANEYGALNIKKEDGWMKIYFSPVQAISDSIVVKSNDRVVYSKKIIAKPLQLFADSFKTNVAEDAIQLSIGKYKMVYDGNPQADVLNRPLDAPKDFDWNSAYGLYLSGKELMDQKMYDRAEEKLKTSLAKDNNFTPALVKLAELLYRNMRYKEALDAAEKALRIDTHAGDANYYYGLINLELNRITDAKDGFDIASLSADYRSASYTMLSRIYIKEQNLEKALHYAIKACDYNQFNIDALQMQALIYRQIHDEAASVEVIRQILSADPLNHFAGFESYLQQPSEKSKQTFISLIRNELPQETITELAIWYYKTGMTKEAKTLFNWIPSSVEAAYWLAFLDNKQLNFSTLNPTLSFPFRSETAMVMEHLLQQQNEWLLKYQLALIYKDRNRLAEAKQLLKDCGNQPAFAPFYATRAALLREDDSSALSDLKKAAALDPQWRYQKLLAEYYIGHKQYDDALLVAEPFYKANPSNYIMGMLYAKTLLLTGKYKATDALLTGINIIPFEGATDGRSLYREAKLMQAAEQMEQQQYEKALAFVNQSQEWPENLGVGKPYEEDIDVRLEDWMTYLCNLHLRKTIAVDDRLAKIIAFKPLTDNTVRNFIGSNALVTVWAYQKINKAEDGKQWLEEQLKLYPQNKSLLWSKAVLNQENSPVEAEDKDANMRILERLMQLKEK